MIVPPLRTLALRPGAHKAPPRGPGRGFAALLAAVLVAIIGGCGGKERTNEQVRLPVDVFSDTARVFRLGSADSLLPSRSQTAAGDTLPRATVWLARVSPSAPVRIEPSVTPSEPSEVAGSPWPAPPGLAVDEGLKPPIPRGSARLGVPSRTATGWVELDVRVDETGAVSDVEWAGGASDSARIEAATAYAFAMRWFPALQDGRPIAVWCRQRIDFGR